MSARLAGRTSLLMFVTVTGALALQVVDRLRFARLPAGPLGGWIGGGDERFVQSLLAAVGVDVGVLLLLILAGGALVPRRLALGALRPVLALLAGISLQIVVGLTLLPPPASLAVVVLVAVLLTVPLRRAGLAGGWRRSDAGALALAALTTTVTAIVVRSQGLVILSNDSWEYWDGARLLAAGELGVEALDSKRMLALQALHAPGIRFGIDGIMTVGPLLLVAAVLLLALFPLVVARTQGRVQGRLVRPVVLATSVAVALIAAASSWLWFTAIYLNTHLLVAALLLGVGVLVAAGGDAGAVRSAMPTITVLLAAVLLSRAEAVLLVGALLLGSLTHAERWQDWRPAWFVLGGTSASWNALLLLGGAAAGLVAPVAVAGLVVGLGLVAAPAVLTRIPATVRTRIPFALGALLWAFVLVLPLTPAGSGIVFAEAARINLGQGEGSWFLTAPIVALAGMFAVAATSDRPSSAPMRWFLIAFIPVTMLAKLADVGTGTLGVGANGPITEAFLSGGGRAKWGDSVNRMWTHGALVALLLLSMVASDVGSRSRRGPLPARRTPRASGVALVLMVVLAGVWWAPDLGPDGPTTATTIADADTVVAGPELTEGTLLSQRIAIPTAIDVPEDVTFLRLCIDVLLTLPGRGPTGTFELGVEVGGQRAEAVFRGAAQREGSDKQVCVVLEPPLPATATATIAGLGGRPGRVVAVLTDADGRFVRTATVDVEAPSLDPRGRIARAISWSIRRSVEWGPIGVGLALLLLLPSVRRERSSGPPTR